MDASSSTNPIVTWLIIGVVCLIPPLTPVGIGLLVFTFVVSLFSRTIDRQEEAMIEETAATGDGCGAFLATVVLIIVVSFLALALGIAAMEGMVTGGMVAR